MDARTLWEVMGKTLPLARYEALLPAYEQMLSIVGARSVTQCAMIAAQLGHESVGLKYQEEIASGAAYEGRRDLGNTQPGDGVRFKGHGWIQVTGRHNHTAVSQWAHQRGIVPTPTYFVDNPKQLGSDAYCWVGPAWYLTAARPGFMAAADRGDLDTCTRMINGGLNGIQDRRTRYHRALTFGTRLLPGKADPVKIVHPMGPPSTVWRQTSGYGQRWGSMHAGTDYGAPVGTPIYAPTDGVVVQGRDRARGSVSGFGSWIWLDCQTSCGRDFIFGHGHHPGILVKRGDRVTAGQQIGVVGNEGQSTGPHLHFEVWGPPGRTGGRHEDPAAWLARHITPTPSPEGELMGITDIVRDIWTQLRGVNGTGWPQLGQNTAGQNLTLVDGVAAARQDIADLGKRLDAITAKLEGLDK